MSNSSRPAAIAGLSESETQRAAFFAGMPPVTAVDRTDGLRLTFDGGEVVHLRPSGNAPELRCYAEAATGARAAELVSLYLQRLATALG